MHGLDMARTDSNMVRITRHHFQFTVRGIAHQISEQQLKKNQPQARALKCLNGPGRVPGYLNGPVARLQLCV